MKRTLKDWVFATRPWSLTASAMPALLTISYIFYIQKELNTPIYWWNGIWAMLGAVIFQVGGNLLNDYFDYVYKVDRKDTLSSRILVDGVFTPRSIFIYGLLSLLVGSLIGVCLLISSGWHLLWIGGLGFLGTYFYNHMKYVALGDLVIFLIYGWLISLGIAYVMTGELMWQALVVSSSAGLLIVAILHANNTRDILNDSKADIKTQAMKLGVEMSKKYFIFLTLGAYLLLLGMVLFGLLSPCCLIAFLTLPMVIGQIKQINKVDEATLNQIQFLPERVAQLVLIYCVLLSIANFVVGGLIS
ncbi:prenyltransferase [Bacteroides sp. 224]|uniref:prenyltransferase n=1 Tax=Bacteroides sp. 224 TaxID=2302936 RepID=UPI0013D5F845|nr:prenyltransferase [Bacteroides sp. 224]NDV65243.1 prenyltransferase [Bacteroides sp. 224]